MRRSTIREILKITKRSDIISFAGGLPAPELFPLREFRSALNDALQRQGLASLQYDVTEGFLPLKEFLSHWIGRRGIQATPDRMLLTNGSQQGLDLLGKVFLNPGDHVLVEDPTYLGAIQAFNAYQASYSPIPMDQKGLLLENVQTVLRRNHPRLAYLVPTFQNPSGITMSTPRRAAFLKLAQANRLPIIEDDPYGYLRFHGEASPSIYQMARGRGVIYLSTFSKILSPGIRLGFLLAEPEVIQALTRAKQAADLQPNSLIQRAVYCYAKSGHLEKHIPVITEAYRQRADAMMHALLRYFPKSIQWNPPEGGMFIWCRLPKGRSAVRLFPEALRAKVAYVTGNVFHAGGGGTETFRLNFTNSTVKQIKEGVRRLGIVFSKAL